MFIYLNKYRIANYIAHFNNGPFVAFELNIVTKYHRQICIINNAAKLTPSFPWNLPTLLILSSLSARPSLIGLSVTFS